MINLKVENYCKECPNFDVEQDTHCAKNLDGDIVFTTHTLTCIHKDRCAHLFKHIKQCKINEMDDKET